MRGSLWVGGPFWWPGWYGYPYGYPYGWGWYDYGYGYPYPFVHTYPYPSTVFIHDSATPPDEKREVASQWRYCPDSRMFYPHVSECASGWQSIPMTAAGPSNPSSPSENTPPARP